MTLESLPCDFLADWWAAGAEWEGEGGKEVQHERGEAGR